MRTWLSLPAYTYTLNIEFSNRLFKKGFSKKHVFQSNKRQKLEISNYE